MTINTLLNQLVAYAVQQKLVPLDDVDYAINQLLYLFRIDVFTKEDTENNLNFFPLMAELMNYAVNSHLLENDFDSTKDNFEAKVMDCFLPRPSDLNRQFNLLYKQGPKVATDYFYQLSKATNYIKTNRISKNITYHYLGKYGKLDITINLSKPEKDPKLIALSHGIKSENYPLCALCMENVGFYGTADKAPRSNHRVVTLSLNHEKDAWGLQYSPYAYYNEHCIVLKKVHEPMRVDSTTFLELIDFINKFPHYTIGSNAGLPIVGGSILSHYHFQGGRYDFPIENAKVLATYRKKRVDIEILDWPLSVIRLIGQNEFDVLDRVNEIFEAWKSYSNPDLDILAQTSENHNTITPIVKLRKNKYEFYIVLRNNRTTPTRSFGLFHPRDEYFHIKKENIGLIEVMGLAVLPGRLESELHLIQECLINHDDPHRFPELEKHLDWISTLKPDNLEPAFVDQFLKNEVGRIFELVLEDCGVFKSKDFQIFKRFLEKTIL